MNSIQSKTHLIARSIILCLGLAIMALGVACSIHATLGTSPISSFPYVTSCVSGLSVGTTTILMNCAFVLLQILILRRNYQWIQLLQIPAAILFGLVIDLGVLLIEPIPCPNYLAQWGFCALGILLVGLGVGIEVMAGLITTAGEGLVLAICKVCPIPFGNMKILFDVSLVCLSVVVSFLFLHTLSGVREGTFVAAFCVGLVAKCLSKPLAQLERRYLS